MIQLNCIMQLFLNNSAMQRAVVYVNNNRSVQSPKWLLSTSGLGQVTSVMLALGTNHFGHRYFPSLGVILATIFTSPETRMNLLPDSENRMIVASFISTKHRNVTEGRTDGGRDGHDRSIYSGALQAVQAVQTAVKILLLNIWHWNADV